MWSIRSKSLGGFAMLPFRQQGSCSCLKCIIERNETFIGLLTSNIEMPLFVTYLFNDSINFCSNEFERKTT